MKVAKSKSILKNSPLTTRGYLLYDVHTTKLKAVSNLAPKVRVFYAYFILKLIRILFVIKTISNRLMTG